MEQTQNVDSRRVKSRIKNKTIKTTNVLTQGGLIIACVLILMIVTYFFSRHSFKLQVLEDTVTTTKQTALTVDAMMAANEKLVNELANADILTEPTYDFEERVAFYQKRAKELGFQLFFYTDKKGMCTNLTPTADKLDVSDTEYFKQSIAGKIYTSNIIIDKLNGNNIFIISAPYYVDGKIAGIFAGIKNVDFLSEISSTFSWGKSGILAILDGDTNVIGHTRQSVVDSNLNIM